MENKKKQSPKTEKQDIHITTQFLGSVLQRATAQTNHLDIQSNILIGISLAVFVFTASQHQGLEEKIFLLVLGIFTAVSAIFSLLSVHPPRFMRKKGQKESLMYSGGINTLSSQEKYAELVKKAMESNDSVIREYATEVFNVYSYYYRPKRKLFNASRNILLTGFVLSFFIFLVEFIANHI